MKPYCFLAAVQRQPIMRTKKHRWSALCIFYSYSRHVRIKLVFKGYESRQCCHQIIKKLFLIDLIFYDEKFMDGLLMTEAYTALLQLTKTTTVCTSEAQHFLVLPHMCSASLLTTADHPCTRIPSPKQCTLGYKTLQIKSSQISILAPQKPQKVSDLSRTPTTVMGNYLRIENRNLQVRKRIVIKTFLTKYMPGRLQKTFN